MDVRHNNNALQELNDCIRGLLHLGLNVITFRTLLHLGPNVITFRTLLHLGQLLHLGLQQGEGGRAFLQLTYNLNKFLFLSVPGKPLDYDNSSYLRLK